MNLSPSVDWLLLLLWVWPLLLAALAGRWRWDWLPALGALPALIASGSLAADTRLELPWLLLGATLGLDAGARVVLLFSGLLWLLAGVFVATPMGAGLNGQRSDGFLRRRFNACFLLAMSGQLWAVVGLDAISFYVGFAIMGLASYALVVADGSARALRAGRLYLAMTVVGEVALFAGLVSLAAQSATLTPTPALLARVSDSSLVLVLAGLGVKAAIVPLHFWLPLTYPAAPVAATAVLSSAMIKVALLGWLRWLPLGAVAWPGWSLALVLIGLIAALYALAIGLLQREPKVVLAYSSIAKMGFLLLLVGLLLGQPELFGAGSVALVFYAAHHALCKAGLFLGLGLHQQQWLPGGRRTRSWLRTGLVFLALALAGAPLTSGALAKYLAKPLLHAAPWGWLDPLLWLMTLVTMMLMARFLWLVHHGGETRIAPLSAAAFLGGRADVAGVFAGTGSVFRSLLFQQPAEDLARREPSAADGLDVQAPLRGPALVAPLLGWGLLVGLLVALPWVYGPASAWLTNTGNFLLVLGVGAAVIMLARRGFNPLGRLVGRVPPGDMLPLVARVARGLGLAAGWLWQGWQGLSNGLARRLAWGGRASPMAVTSSAAKLEARLRTWPVAGALWLALGTLLVFLLLAGARS